MSNKKQTAMQDLRQDLIHAIDTAKDALEEIENETIRSACQEVARLTLKNIIQRIDEELLELEKQQIIEARVNGVCEGIDIGGNPITEDISKNHEIYYNETFNK